MNAEVPRSAMQALATTLLALHFLVALAGCSGVSVEEQALVATQPGAELVRLAPLDGCCSIVVGSRVRGQLDVFNPRAIEIGSFLSGFEGAVDMELGSVGGRPVVFVNGGGSEVTMITNDLTDAQRLRPPNQVFETDQTIFAMAAGDLDRDGMDELVVARGDGLKMIDRLEIALFADPEHVPDLNRNDIPNGIRASDIGVVDMNGDLAPDVIALSADSSEARVWDSPGFGGSETPDVDDISLGGRGISLATTRCEEGARVFAVLDSGAVVSITLGGASENLPTGPDATHIVSAGDGFLVVYGDGSATLHDACGAGGAVIDVNLASAVDVHLTRRLLDGRRLAVVREDGQSVELYKVDAGY